MITQSELKSVLQYEPRTGLWTWRVSHRGQKKAGDFAGTPTHNGYTAIKIAQKVYSAHRLAFLYMTGAIPGIVDHVNGVRSDNKWGNLRGCTQAQNCANAAKRARNTSGYKGVTFDKRCQKWTAQIMVQRKYHHLGRFETPEAAHVAYCQAAKRLVGEFARVA